MISGRTGATCGSPAAAWQPVKVVSVTVDPWTCVNVEVAVTWRNRGYPFIVKQLWILARPPQSHTHVYTHTHSTCATTKIHTHTYKHKHSHAHIHQHTDWESNPFISHLEPEMHKMHGCVHAHTHTHTHTHSNPFNTHQETVHICPAAGGCHQWQCLRRQRSLAPLQTPAALCPRNHWCQSGHVTTGCPGYLFKDGGKAKQCPVRSMIFFLHVSLLF